MRCIWWINCFKIVVIEVICIYGMRLSEIVNMIVSGLYFYFLMWGIFKGYISRCEVERG